MCKIFRVYLLVFVARFWKDYSIVSALLHSKQVPSVHTNETKILSLISSAYHMTSGRICMCDLLMVTRFKAKLFIIIYFSMNISMQISQLGFPLPIAAMAGGAALA